MVGGDVCSLFLLFLERMERMKSNEELIDNNKYKKELQEVYQELKDVSELKNKKIFDMKEFERLLKKEITLKKRRKFLEEKQLILIGKVAMKKAKTTNLTTFFDRFDIEVTRKIP